MTKGMTLAAAVLAVGALAIADAPAHAEEATIQGDQFDKDITIVGPEESDNPFAGTYRGWRLRSWIDKATHTARNQLYVELRYDGDWRYYESAADDTAQSLETVAIDRQVDNCYAYCSFTETIGVAIPMETLRVRATSGFAVKLYAKSGDTRIIEVSPAQIQAQLAAIDRFGPSTPAAAPPSASGKVSLGVLFAPLNSNQLAALRIASDHGLMVAGVLENSPAARAGIQRGDVILSFNGKPTAAIPDLTTAVQGQPPNSKANVHLWRVDKEIDVLVQF